MYRQINTRTAASAQSAPSKTNGFNAMASAKETFSMGRMIAKRSPEHAV